MVGDYDQRAPVENKVALCRAEAIPQDGLGATGRHGKTLRFDYFRVYRAQSLYRKATPSMLLPTSGPLAGLRRYSRYRDLHPLASEVGLPVLKADGNAVDAALAAVATLRVVEPAMTGIGMIVPRCTCWPARRGRSPSTAGRAPAADPAWYADQGITRSTADHAVTVPGAVAAWELLNRDHGRMPLADLLAPARPMPATAFRLIRGSTTIGF